jgi:SAM-dependent methyltransferase
MPFPITHHDGHAILKDGDHSILVDTGSPSTMHQHGPFPFMGREFPAQRNLMGLITAENLTDMVGTPVTTLMGMDIIGRFRVHFSYRNGTLDFTGDEVGMTGNPVTVESFMGIPIVEAEIHGKPRRMFVDSGAKLSYLSAEYTAGMASEGVEQDFYPGHGRFQTPTYLIETSLAGYDFMVRYGNLPAALTQLLKMGGADGILGSDLFYAFDLGLDMRAGRLHCQPVAVDVLDAAPERRAHDNWSNLYDYVYETSFGSVYQTLTSSHLDNITRFLQNGSIIDYGAGTGRLAIPLAQRGYRVVAVEPSTGMVREMVRKIEQAGLNIPVRTETIAGHGQEEEPADMALCLFTVMSYITDTEEMKKSLRNIARNLKPGGLLFFDLPGEVFFQRPTVMAVNEIGLKRTCTLRPWNGPIYKYREEAEGIFHGHPFNYTDEFELRKWNWPEMIDMLTAEGFEDLLEDFRNLAWTGSAYRMFRKRQG